MALHTDISDGGTGEARSLRADAARNRAALLAAAAEVFREQGVEASVSEIAARAGIGRGTLFRNFPTKRDLVIAVVVERMHAGIREAEELLARAGDEELLFPFVEWMVGVQQVDRALFEFVGAEEFMASEQTQQAHAEIVASLDKLIAHDVERGYVRPGVGAMDVLMLVKGACVVATEFAATAPASIERHLSFVRAALSAPGRDAPLYGSAPTLADLRPSA